MKFRLAAAALLWVPLFARALDSTPLSMVYEEAPPPRASNGNVTLPETAAPIRFDGCSTRVRALADIRPNKLSVGGPILIFEGFPGSVPINAFSVRSGDGLGWLRGAVATLKSRGLPVDENAPAGVEIALRSAQTWTASTNLLSHVVLQARYAQTGQPVTRRYHGFATRLNGFGANFEFMSTLNLGMEDALRQLSQDLQRACRGEGV